MRPIEQLLDTREPAIELISTWTRRAVRPVEVLPVDPARGREALLALQVTTRSPLGALAHDTGGLLVDDGWVRVLGGGCERLKRSIDGWNVLARPVEDQRLPRALLVGDDAVGGFFACNGGGLAGPAEHVFYLAPDTYEWEDLEVGYSDWLRWLCGGDLEAFYAALRWPGWREDVRALDSGRVFHVAPPMVFAGPPIGLRSRSPVPIDEQWHFSRALEKQLAGVRDGQEVRLVVDGD